MTYYLYFTTIKACAILADRTVLRDFRFQTLWNVSAPNMLAAKQCSFISSYEGIAKLIIFTIWCGVGED